MSRNAQLQKSLKSLLQKRTRGLRLRSNSLFTTSKRRRHAGRRPTTVSRRKRRRKERGGATDCPLESNPQAPCSTTIPGADSKIRTEEKWLSNVEIDNYLSYMAKSFPGVLNANFVSIDFDQFCSVDKEVDICALSIPTLDKNINHVVMPMNLDTREGPGFHWTANYVFLDRENGFKNSFYYYFDSAKTNLSGVDVGKEHKNPVEEAPNSVQKLHRRFQREIQELKGGPFPLKINHRRHQRGNNNCGVYVIFVLTLLCSPLNKPLTFDIYLDENKKLDNRPVFKSQQEKLDFLEEKEITDGAMNHYREMFFKEAAA